jgi:hypothetical protein
LASGRNFYSFPVTTYSAIFFDHVHSFAISTNTIFFITSSMVSLYPYEKHKITNRLVSPVAVDDDLLENESNHISHDDKNEGGMALKNLHDCFIYYSISLVTQL